MFDLWVIHWATSHEIDGPWIDCDNYLPLLLLPYRLTLEVRDRQARVDVLGTKFDTLASKNRATDPVGGEPKSQAYYIIKVRLKVFRGWRQQHPTPACSAHF